MRYSNWNIELIRIVAYMITVCLTVILSVLLFEYIFVFIGIDILFIFSLELYFRSRVNTAYEEIAGIIYLDSQTVLGEGIMENCYFPVIMSYLLSEMTDSEKELIKQFFEKLEERQQQLMNCINGEEEMDFSLDKEYEKILNEKRKKKEKEEVEEEGEEEDEDED